MIIDAHCHAGKGDRMTAPWNTDPPLHAYLRRARPQGIAGTIVLPAFHSDYAVANAQLANIVREHTPSLIGFAMVNCARDAGRLHDVTVSHAVHQYGFQGVKLHGADALPRPGVLVRSGPGGRCSVVGGRGRSSPQR